MSTIERRKKITIKEFQTEYLIKNKPVIVTDGMEQWEARSIWTPDYFMANHGNEEVQLYDDLFNLTAVITLNEYIKKYFGNQNLNLKEGTIIPYIRWYTRLKDSNFVWADSFFDKIKTHWELPYFLPNTKYLLPYNFNTEKINPNKDNFPGKGIFISAKGAKTRLHYDPWGSDAVLCQIYGSKEIIMYDPSQKEFLYKDNEYVNIETPDYNKFPYFKQAKPTFIDILNPGEIIFFPHNWLHHVSTIADSISVTWNFIHISTWAPFFNYLINNPSLQEIEVMKFFIKN